VERRWIFVPFAMTGLSCLGPTEIVLTVDTDVACSVVAQQGVEIDVGVPGDEDAGLAGRSITCSSDGSVGSLVFLPSGDIGDAVGIRVMLGIDASTASCGRPSYDGCIVARRSLRFDPHTPLHLPVSLDENCIGQPCTPDSTCANGLCVDASVSCTSGNCNVGDGGGGPPPPPPDASLPCTLLADVPIRTTSIITAPRIAYTGSSWIIAMVQSNGDLEIDTVQSNGTPVAVPTVTVASASRLGPFGSDGVGYAGTYATDSGIITAVEGVGPPSTQSFSAFGAIAVADQGCFFASSNYTTAAIGQGHPQLFTFPSNVLTNPTTTSGGITSTAPTALSITRDGPTMYVSFADGGACPLWSCTDAGNGAWSCTSIDNVPSCIGLRVASRSGTRALVSESANGSVVVDKKYTVSTLFPAAENVMVLPTGPSFQVLWAINGTLSHAPYDGQNAPTSATIPTGPNVMGFDAVEDAPGSPGYAVAYISEASNIGTVHFVHLCN
jgi:hypothetical protein